MADEVGPSVLVLTSAQNRNRLSEERDRPDASCCDTEPLASVLCASAAQLNRRALSPHAGSHTDRGPVILPL